MSKLFLLFGLISLSGPAFAELDAESEVAKSQAMSLLTASGGEASALAKQVSCNPEAQRKLQELSASIFSTLAEKTNGDANLMQEHLSNAKRDPASLIQSLTPDQQKTLSEIAAIISKSKGKCN